MNRIPLETPCFIIPHPTNDNGYRQGTVKRYALKGEKVTWAPGKRGILNRELHVMEVPECHFGEGLGVPYERLIPLSPPDFIRQERQDKPVEVENG